MQQRDYLELVALGGIWGASFLFMRVAAPEFGPLPLIEVRVAIAAAVLMVVLACRGELPELNKNRTRLIFVGLFNSAIPFSLFAYATLTLPAGYASVLNATSPLFGAVVARIWLHEPMPAWKTIGLIVGFAGVLLLVSEKLSLSADRSAVAAGLAGALAYGVVASYTKRRLSHVKPMVVATGSLMWASIFLFPFAIRQWPEVLPSSTSWWCALALGLLCTAVAYILYFRMIARLGPVKASTVAYLIPVFGMMWGYLFRNEAITVYMLGGATVIMAGVAMMSKPQRPSALQKTTLAMAPKKR